MSTRLKLAILLFALFGSAVGVRISGRDDPSSGDELVQRLQRQSNRLEALLARIEKVDRQPTPGACESRPAAEPPVEPGALRPAIATALREELDRRAAVPPVDPRSEPPRESVIAASAGQQIIQAALSARQWGERQAQEMRKLLPTMTIEQREQALQELSAAINRGDITVAVSGPPF